MGSYQPQEYSIRSGRTGENTEVLASEYQRIFGQPTCAIHGGNDEIDSYQERSRKALEAQQRARGEI